MDETTGVTQRDSGSILDGKYEILDRLATGGMGEVYRARHIHLQEMRVIKILRADRATDPHALQRFGQEARIATQIKHPNVATLYDFARLPDGSFYMVWEHIAGEDVGTILRTKGPLPLNLAVELGIQALRGLDAIHTAGVIHRDLSPDNLMIARDRRGKPLLKIIDLGLAKNLEAQAGLEITQAGMFMGKLMYCSPEQAGSIGAAPLDHRSDLYSLATVVYEMVTGKPPFDSESAHGYVLKRLAEPPQSMIGRTPEIRVPPKLNEVVLRGLEKDREKRWPDALSFLHALVRVADALRQVSTQEIPALPTERSPSAASIVGPRPGSRSTPGEMSREEKLELLAQIDRAAKRVNEAGKLADEARAALAAGRPHEARERLARLESVAPHHPELLDLRKQVARAVSGSHPLAPAAAPAPPAAARAAAPAAAAPAAAPAAALEATPAAVPPPPPAPPPPPRPLTPAERERLARVAEAESILDKYIRERKQSLAQFALETLVDLEPAHPKRAEYQAAIELAGQEAVRLKNAEATLEEARQALVRGDTALARRRLDEVDRLDPTGQLAAAVRQELAEAEESARTGAELAKRRERLEQMLETRRIHEAEKELERLAEAGLARVSVESYRLRISDLAALADRDKRSQEYERRCRVHLEAQNWTGAREIVLEFERAVPDSPRPAQLFAEISELEQAEKKQQGIEQGVRQLETFLGQKKVAEAEMTLKILLQMAPNLPDRARFEARVKALRQA
jgi:serine/threonine-protein kinase